MRALLDEHDLAWFETTAGNWGIAMPALWVEHDADKARARALIDDYQQRRAQQQREAHERQRAAGEAPSLLSRWRERPVAVASIFAFCAFLIYVMTVPFLRLIGLSGS